MKVLIVDDIETNRKLLRVNLEAGGIETYEASDGIEALKALEQEKADAIISDILMPHMDGYQFCQKVRKDDRFGDVPFIFYTSTYTSPGDEKLALDCGADRYIKKPAPISAILSPLKELTAPSRPQRTQPPEVVEEALVMREYNEALVRKLEERNTKLEEAREEITKANAELERRVEERTAELVAANQELEAFSHSLAHDLRSPLMAVDGLSHILIGECQGKVSPVAMEHLQFIIKAARRMNDLTNDLLRLARASRAEMTCDEVDLSPFAAAIVRDLRELDPERRVEVLITPNLHAWGDLALLRILLENLLNNAWKFTGRTRDARIEVGRTQVGDELACFVRDNGAGFDMSRADKLFTNFERLHTQDEFPGTGIGLTTVERVIRRHGGRVWAEGERGKGATFYFTLGDMGARES